MDADARRSIAAQIAVGLASFLTPFLYGALAVAMPTIGRDFSFSPREMAVVMMIHLLFSTACNLPFGRLSDRVGRKYVFLAGSLLFTISSLMASQAQGPALLMAARALQGVGDAMTFGVSAAILVSIVPSERTGRALGLNTAFVYAGLALGPLVGGELTAWLSWRVIFHASAGAGLGAFLLIAGYYREEAHHKAEAPDPASTGLFLAAMLSLMLGISLQPALSGMLLLACSPFLFAALLRVDSRSGRPLLDVAYLRRNRAFTLECLTSTVGFIAGFPTSFLSSLFLQNALNLPADQAGYILLVLPLVLTLTSPLSGKLSDGIHPAKVASAGLAIQGVGFWIFAALAQSASPAMVAALLGIVGVGFGLFVTANINAIMRSADAPHMGMASGLLATMRGLGMSLSLALVGVILALKGGNGGQSSGQPMTEAVRMCLWLFGTLSFAAAWMSHKAAALPLNTD